MLANNLAAPSQFWLIHPSSHRIIIHIMHSHTLSLSSRIVKLSRLAFTAVSLSVVSLAASPSTAQVVGADGNYRVTGGSGSLSSGGETRKIPKSVFNTIIKEQSGGIVVKNQKLKINRDMAALLLQSIAGNSSVITTSKVTGPSSITLVPTGSFFTGKTLQPIVAKFSGKDGGEKFSVTVKTYANATVKADAVTLTTRFSATDGSDQVSGIITLVGKR